MRGITKIILLLTVVAVGLVGSSLAIMTAREESIQEEVIFISPPAQTEHPASTETVQTPPPEEEVPASTYTAEEMEILAIIVYQEAGGNECSDDTRRKVGSVFLNRVASSYFPDTFEEVATGKRQYGTLYLTGIKWPDRAIYPEEAHAVERAYRIAKELLTEGSILPAHVIWQAEFKQGDGVYCYQDGIYFCYSEVSK